MVLPLVAAGLAAGGVASVFGINEATKYNPDNDPYVTDARPNQVTFGSSGAQTQADQLQNIYGINPASLSSREGATMNAAEIDQTKQAQFRRGQQDFVTALQKQAAGKGTSVAQTQMQQGKDASIKQAMAMSASQPGVNPAMAARMAQESAATTNLNTNQQLATLRAQEQATARAQLGGALQSARAQDIGLASSQAQLTQQASAANLQAEMRQRQMNDQIVDSLMKQGLSRDQAEAQTALASEQQKMEYSLTIGGMNQAESQGQRDFLGNMITAGGQGLVSSMGSGSDEKIKTDIDESDDEMDKFLNTPLFNPKGGLVDSPMVGNMAGVSMPARKANALQNVTPSALSKGVSGAGKSLGATNFGAAASGAGASLSTGLASIGPGAAAALSDKKTKKDVKDSAKNLDTFVEALNASKWKYKEPYAQMPNNGEGEHFGVMAQELLKSKVGKSMVDESPDGTLYINTHKSIGPMLASIQRLNERINELDKKVIK